MRALACIFDGNGSAVSAFKVPRRGYLSSFCRVHALIGGVINHRAAAAERTSRIHSLASIRVIIICAAERACTSARWINCVSRRHGDYNISMPADIGPERYSGGVQGGQ
jgi:hypothetical protein